MQSDVRLRIEGGVFAVIGIAAGVLLWAMDKAGVTVPREVAIVIAFLAFATIVDGVIFLAAPFFTSRATEVSASGEVSNPSLARLEIIWSNEPPYIGNQEYYRIGIRNHGPASAKNVAVTLERIDPDPLRDVDRILPSRIGEKGGYCQPARMACEIPSGREHYYDVFRALSHGNIQGLFFGLQTVERLDIPFMLRDDQELLVHPVGRRRESFRACSGSHAYSPG